MNALEQARFNMVEQQIRPWQVLDPAVLHTLQHVAREIFVPAAYQALAYTDTDIPLGHRQAMVAPRIDARLLNDLAITPTDKVLEIGTGSGYLTALLADRSHHVVSLEINPELHANARKNLQRAGINNVDLRLADGSAGTADTGPFDAIVLGGSVHAVPQELLEQIKIGGRLIAIVGEDPVMQATLYNRTSASAWDHRALWDTSAPRLLGFTEPSRFHF
jgi:protein-L-isoaspartate(D-aspartate) O-methyltransferase